MMDGRGLLEQVDALVTMVARQKQELSELPSRHGVGMERVVDARDRLFQIHSKVEKEAGDFARRLKGNPAQHYAADKWELLAGLRKRCQALNVDCFAFDQTLRFREGASIARQTEPKQERNVCLAADAMIEDFSAKVGDPRTSYVLLSESAMFDPRISAVHQSYSNLSLWNLNRTAHEFGHQWAEGHANGAEGAQRGFVENVKDAWEEPVAKEFFADMVAAFMMGWAYGYSCLLLDFNPINRISSSTHPSHDERAHCILMALAELQKDMAVAIVPRVRGLIGDLKTYWSEAREKAGAGGAPANLGKLQAEVPITMRRLKEEIPRAQFVDAAQAFRVKVALKDSLRLPEKAEVATVLNGAWLARLNRNSEDFKDLDPAILGMLLNGGAIEQAG